MKKAILLAQKEWKETFNAPTPYIAMAVFFLLAGWFWTASLFLTGQATLDEFFGPLPFLLAIFLPAFTMRLFSEEYKSGTIETLATLPLDDTDIVLGKFLAVAAMWAAMLGLSFVFLGLLLTIGRPDLGPIAAGYIGTFLLGLLYLALGLLASSLTRSQVVAFLLGFVFCFVFFILGKSAQFMPGALGSVLLFLGVDRHVETFSRGVIDTRDVLYFVSFTLLALGGTLVSFNSRRWRS